MGHNLTWSFGRRLASFDGIAFTYNEDGIRTSKTVNGVKTNIYIDGTRVIHQTDGTNTFHFRYDSDGSPIGFVYNNADYFYIKNLQGDIMGILDSTYTLVAEYSYDEWGKVIAVTGTNTTLGNLNPLRYRGYYYDTETGLYYLQSRYYDPETGRFINADDFNYVGLFDTSVSFNAFAYCSNNPVMFADPTGENHSKQAEDQPLSLPGAFIAVYLFLVAILNAFQTQPISTPNISIGESPSLNTQAQSATKATSRAAAKADTKIKNKIKNNSKEGYWKAELVVSSDGSVYVSLGLKITYAQAVTRVKNGKSVFTNKRTYAEKLARVCSSQKTLSYEIHDTYGYSYYHYHPNPRNGAHIWFLFF